MKVRGFELLGSAVHTCGKAPIFAALALLVSSVWLDAQTTSDASSGVVARLPTGPEPDPIDEFLSKRAPDLGLTLRHQLGAAIAEESRLSGYDPLLILAIIDVESSFDDDAISPKGAHGLMQIRPGTLKFWAKHEGIRLTNDEIAADPALRVRLGIRYLRNLQDRFHDLDLALMAYNAGPTKLRLALKGKCSSEFRAYARLVRQRFRRFREGEGLDGEWALAFREGHVGTTEP